MCSIFLTVSKQKRSWSTVKHQNAIKWPFYRSRDGNVRGSVLVTKIIRLFQMSVHLLSCPLTTHCCYYADMGCDYKVSSLHKIGNTKLYQTLFLILSRRIVLWFDKNLQHMTSCSKALSYSVVARMFSTCKLFFAV